MAKKPEKKKNRNKAPADVSVQKSKPTPKAHMNESNVAHSVLSAATILLVAAAAICVLMIIAVFIMPEGRAAASAIGGFPVVPVPERTLQWFMLLDTLFPIFYGSGIAALATGIQSRGNRPVIRLALTAVLLGVILDFSENTSIFAALSGGTEVPDFTRILTVLKYTSLAFAGVLISVAMPPSGTAGQLAKAVARYVFPVGIALLVSGIGGETARGLVGAGFPIALIILAVYAQSLMETS